MNRSLLPALALPLTLALAACAPETPPASDPPEKEHRAPLVSRIAFGSCGEQYRPQPVLDRVLAQQPDLFVYLGDNIYGDTQVMDTLRAKYAQLAAHPEFQRLKAAVPLVATWDDHDYGWNDSGRHYAFKAESKQIFLDFFDAPPDDVRRTREGIYTSYFFEEDGRTLQLILLDTRTFRDDLCPYRGEPVDTVAFHYGLDYWPHETADSTLLGEAQWRWLETQLTIPADLRLIGTSTQFGITYNGYEAWANFPHERERMVDLIRKTRAEGVLFLSGDVHYAEVSRLSAPGLYPLYDVTASGITSTWHFATPNDNRVEGPVMENHFGLLVVDWEQDDPEIALQVHDVDGRLRVDRRIRLSQLRF